MRLFSSKNSLAFLCILAGIIYLIILTPIVIEGIESAVQGTSEGFESSRKIIDNDPYQNFESERFLLKLTLKDKRKYYPDSLVNITTKEILPVRFETVSILYQHRESPTLGSIFFQMFLMLVSLPVGVLMVYIPILFYKLILSLYRNHVFTPDNVKRIEKIGIFCIIVYLFVLSLALHMCIQAKGTIDLEKYKIVYPNPSNELLLFGIVALIVATVMKRAIAIKEEQDLTI